MILREILKCSQEKLKLKLVKKLVEYYNNNVIIGDGYAYAKGSLPIMLIAHMDTVHNIKPTDDTLFYDKAKQVMWCPDGIGGDDRCGVYAIMKLLELGYRPHVLFTEDEEIGNIGANKFCTNGVDLSNVNFLVELDRRGADDCVFYRCDNHNFHGYIETFGFVKSWGSCSDISAISPKYDIASVNLSVGYYHEHGSAEFIRVNELWNTIKRVENILLDCKNTTRFDYQPFVYQVATPKKKKVYYDDYCDLCGEKLALKEGILTANNLLVCDKCYEILLNIEK